jgi:hypothetical protein
MAAHPPEGRFPACKHRLWFLLAVFLGTVAAPSAGAESWTILSADYGIGNQRRDVTARVRRLLGNGRLRVLVNNDALGVDPAPGRLKTLRIRARTPKGLAREFTYPENEGFEARLFRPGPPAIDARRPPGGGAGDGYPGPRGRLNSDDQKYFDGYYSRWVAGQRAHNGSAARTFENRMFDIYAAYRIPRSVPFERVASRP